ncbi:hypothetical protein ACFQ07_12330, partial [Actinomadura adrarensis]
ASENLPAGTGLVPAEREYVTISGHPDKDVERRINTALRADDAMNWYRRTSSGWSGTARSHSEAAVRLQTGRFLSVAYTFGITPQQGAIGTWLNSTPEYATVTVDLVTGRTLGIADIFRPAALTQSGLARLAERIKSHDDRECLTPLAPLPGDAYKPFGIKLSDLQRTGSTIQVALGAREVWFGVKAGRHDMSSPSNACSATSASVPVDELADLMQPGL